MQWRARRFDCIRASGDRVMEVLADLVSAVQSTPWVWLYNVEDMMAIGCKRISTGVIIVFLQCVKFSQQLVVSANYLA